MMRENSNSGLFALAVSVAVGMIAFLYLAWDRWLRPHLEAKKPFPELPMPKSHWYFGHATSIISTGEDQIMPLSTSKEQQQEGSAFWKTMLDHGEKFGGRFGIWVGSRPGFCPLYWEDARALLHAEYYKQRSRFLDKHFNRIGGENSLLLLSGRLWKTNRAAVVKSIKTPSSLSAATGAMTTVTDNVVTSIKERIRENSGTDSVELDLGILTKMITVDVIGLAAFSHDFGCCKELQPQAFARAFEFLGADLMRRLDNNPFSPTNYFYWIPTKENVQNSKAFGLITKFLRSMIRRSQQQQQEANRTQDTNGCNLLGNLLRAQKELDQSAICKGGANTEDNDAILLDIVRTLLFAGYDTTSVTLSYAFYLISQYPEVEANCLEEIYALDRNNTLSNADALVYCNAVIKETLRLYPPAFLASRKLTKPVKLPGDGFVVPTGTSVHIPIWHIHRQEHNFPQPHAFRPDRWVKRLDKPGQGGGSTWVKREYHSNAAEEEKEDESSIPAANPDAFFSFSAGARSCPGQQFALQEAALVIAGVLKELKFRVARPDYVLTPTRNGVIQQPKGGVPMNISIRENKD